jgi:peptidoglycan LD-endopeptidase LytH
LVTVRILPLIIFGLLGAGTAWAQRLEIRWPTPSRAWEQGKGYEAWAQPTVSGELESGLFGCVRSNGTQFHEGLDIRPVARDSRREPTDLVTAAMGGVVRHVSTKAGSSSYGRYVVLEHPDAVPAVYTLYAHLAKIEPGIAPGREVKIGQALGLMGRSAGGYAIPVDRAHLHFEIGLVATTDFASWYAGKKFGSPNEHGLYNGMNLLGIDPWDYLRSWRARQVNNFQEYFGRMRSVVRVRVATMRVPDFIRRYPDLLTKKMPVGPIGGWEVQCNATGLPFAWTPLTPNEVIGMRPNTARIVAVDAAALRAYRCKKLALPRGGGHVPGPDLDRILEQVFGLR